MSPSRVSLAAQWPFRLRPDSRFHYHRSIGPLSLTEAPVAGRAVQGPLEYGRQPVLQDNCQAQLELRSYATSADTILATPFKVSVNDMAQNTKTNADLLRVDVAAIRDDLKDLKLRVTAAESRISRVEDFNNSQSQKISDMKKMVATLQSQLMEQEDQNLRSNPRIFGIPEGVVSNYKSVPDILISSMPSALQLAFDRLRAREGP
ncbi:hypothetical protein NDU88_004354 [Pleurodeles waltl]|uniref:Uncharacterized protein n=1 Tax=Pleurodeles waltl TaxID=8319 RepID=A0AAV7QBP1_PLEWA|nr:hypothetical protein NDU88_004354 [Pleurodeles waltl]